MGWAGQQCRLRRRAFLLRHCSTGLLGTRRAIAALLGSTLLPALNPCRAYADKAKWADAGVPLGWLRQLFDTYVPPAVFEMRKSFQHLVPLSTMNFMATLCSILEVWQDGRGHQ